MPIFYIHLNPLRAKIVSTVSELNRYEYCGHSVLMGYRKSGWQEMQYVLSLIEKKVCELLGIEKGELYAGSRRQVIADARGLFCYWAVHELGYSLAELAEALGRTGPGIGYAVQRGKRIASQQKYKLTE